MNDWHGKHPTPYDFFYSINNASGKDLNWFWQKWFFGWEYPDLSIKKVEKISGGAKIIVINKGGLPVPIYVTITTKSGKETVVKFTAETWKEKKEMSFTTNISMADISKIYLGNEYIPEKYKKDNLWTNK